jgi:hypothetical protein
VKNQVSRLFSKRPLASSCSKSWRGLNQELTEAVSCQVSDPQDIVHPQVVDLDPLKWIHTIYSYMKNILEMTRGSQPLRPNPLIEVHLCLTSQNFTFCQFSPLPSSPMAVSLVGPYCGYCAPSAKPTSFQ